MTDNERKQVLADLDMPETTPADDKRWLQFLSWCDERELDPIQELTIRQTVDATGRRERSLRRDIAEGTFKTNLVQGTKSKEHRVPPARAFILWQSKQKGTSRPTTDQNAEILKHLDAMRSEAERERIQYRELVDQQTRVIDELRAEIHDLKAQHSQLQDQIVRALPAPKGFWARLFSRD